MNDDERGVLLAVGAEGVRDGTLDLAASEALRRGTGVELVHVVHSRVAVPAMGDHAHTVDRALSTVGREVLTDASRRLRDRIGGRLPVNTEMLTGAAAATILDRAASAELVVLERHDPVETPRHLTMSVSTRVAAHAPVPVVVVPRAWSAEGHEALPVTVGVDHPPEALGQVVAAVDYARATARQLVVLHAVYLAEPYQDMVFMDYGRGQWVKDATAEIETALRPLPDEAKMHTAYDVRWTHPTEALVEATRTSSVLVLSRRAGRHPWSGHLGGITRTVLQHAEGPVMLVDRA